MNISAAIQPDIDVALFIFTQKATAFTYYSESGGSIISHLIS